MPVDIKILAIAEDAVQVSITVDRHEERNLMLGTGDTVHIGPLDEDRVRILDGTFTRADIKKFGWSLRDVQ
jgi:hypothetical protein